MNAVKSNGLIVDNLTLSYGLFEYASSKLGYCLISKSDQNQQSLGEVDQSYSNINVEILKRSLGIQQD